MSQAAARLDINLDQETVSVLAKFEEKGSVRAGTKSGACLGFEVKLSLESQEPEQTLIELIKTAHNMCFTEAALRDEVPISTKHTLNGKELSLK